MMLFPLTDLFLLSDGYKVTSIISINHWPLKIPQPEQGMYSSRLVPHTHPDTHTHTPTHTHTSGLSHISEWSREERRARNPTSRWMVVASGLTTGGFLEEVT